MSKAGKFVKKHPWEAAGAAAALGLGGAGMAGMGPLAGMLGAGAAPEVAAAGSAIPGASGLAELAGATGEPLAGTPSVTGGMFGGQGKNIGRAAYAAGKFGLLSPPPTGPQMSQSPIPTMPVTNTVLPSVTGPTGGIDPKLQELLRQWMQQQQGVA